MATFNPDAYLADETFNPDAYLGKQVTPVGVSQIPTEIIQTPAPVVTPPSTLESMFGLGSPIARTIKGAVVDPALAVNQMLANTGLFGSSIKQGANTNVQQYEQATQEARQRMGSTGFDPYQLLGNVISPTNRLVGAVNAPMAAATGIIPATTRAAVTGAGLSALQTVNAPTDQYVEKKLEQMATGAVLGPLIQGGISAFSSLAGMVKGLTASGRTEYLKKNLNELAGPEREKVITALRDAQELVSGSRPTVAEAISNIPSSVELMAAQRKLAAQSGVAGKFVERTTEQQAARVRALNEIANTEAQRTALATERGAVTGSLREQAINQADQAKQILTNIDEQVTKQAGNIIKQTVDMMGAAPGTPTARVLTGQIKPAVMEEADIVAKNLKDFQIKSLEQSGVFPVRASDIVNQLDTAIKGTSSDLSKSVLTFAKNKILSKADENGILSSRDLYDNVRKTLNQDIEAFLQQGQKFAQGGLPEQAAKTAGNVKTFLDASLNKSSDGLWSKYLTSYSDYSNKLNRMEIGDFLSKQLQAPLEKERAGVFATAVENAAGTIKKATGIPRYEKLSDVLSAGEVSAVNNVLADLKRVSKADELAKKVGALDTGLPNLAKEIPSLLSRTVSIGRTAIEHLQRGNAKEFNQQMAELMLNPGATAQFMTSGVKQGKMNELVSSMMKLMDDPTRQAFIQSFTVPALAQEIGSTAARGAIQESQQ